MTTAANVVRFRVNPGMEQAFLDAHRDGKAAWPGLTRGCIIHTGERNYVLVGEWRDMTALADARARMIETLNTFRHTLEDLGAGLGVTDAVSGDVVLALT
jgi:quinol monooxygenase YgiN